jgi:hypothetical protein
MRRVDRLAVPGIEPFTNILKHRVVLVVR